MWCFANLSQSFIRIIFKIPTKIGSTITAQKRHRFGLLSSCLTPSPLAYCTPTNRHSVPANFYTFNRIPPPRYRTRNRSTQILPNCCADNCDTILNLLLCRAVPLLKLPSVAKGVLDNTMSVFLFFSKFTFRSVAKFNRVASCVF